MTYDLSLIKTHEAATWVARTELIRLLDRCDQYALTLLLAPAGAGKSTLLEQWRRMATHGVCVMVTLGKEDAEPAHFFSHLDQSLREQVRDFPGIAFNQLCVEAAIPTQRVADSLRLALEQVSQQVTIVIDDFDHARSSVIHEVIAGLMLQLPSNIHFVLAARRHPEFSLSQLKLKDQLLLLDGNDLKLNRQEVDRFAERLLSRPLTDQESRKLTSMTQGCAAGIKLALLAGIGKESLPLDVPCSNRDELIDALLDRVFRDLPEESQHFLLATAILDRLCAPLCDHLLNRENSLGILENLLLGELFVQPCEGQEGWYRYHSLFRSCLLRRLEAGDAETIRLLHQRAAKWYMNHEDLDEALCHARESGDAEFFYDALRICCDVWTRSGEFGKIIEWVRSSDDKVVRRDWAVLVTYVAALTFSRQYDEAREYLRALKQPGLRPAGPFAERTVIHFLKMMMDLFEQDIDFELTDNHRQILASPESDILKAFAEVWWLYYRLSRGELEEAFACAEKAKPLLANLGYSYLESYADLVVILTSGRGGEILRACVLTNDLFIRCSNEKQGQAWINAATAMAVTQYEQNNLDRALALTEKLIPVVGWSCVLDVVSYAYFIQARVLSLSGQDQRANRLLDDLDRILRHGNQQRFLCHSGVERARQCFQRGDVVGLDRLVRDLGLQPIWKSFQQAPDSYSEVWERQAYIVGLWLRAQNKLTDAELVLRQLKRVLDDKGLVVRALVATANLAVVRMQQGDVREPMTLLADSLRFPGQACFSRTVFDEAPGAGSWVAMGLEKGLFPRPELLNSLFGDLLEPKDLSAPSERWDVEATLTAKEQQILKLLREGLTNEQISREAQVAISTTKWHLKNIYSKLGVANRTEAVVRARRG